MRPWLFSEGVAGGGVVSMGTGPSGWDCIVSILTGSTSSTV